MSEDAILTEAAGGIATITLNRPDKLNAFTADMLTTLRRTLEQADADKAVGAVILTGAGRAFCAGQDLSERAMSMQDGGGPPDLSVTIGEYYNPLIRTIRGLQLPVVCAVNGVAAGAGANVALACDIVIAARSASFIEAFCKIGLVLDAGGSYHLPRLVGRARAAGMALLGDRIDAEKAAEWGLIWQCVDDEELAASANDIARQMADGPSQGLGRIKQALNASLTNGLDEQLDLERDLQKICGESDDYREGVMAFMEKRKPDFGDR